jgi:signal transduction histidine kinase
MVLNSGILYSNVILNKYANIFLSMALLTVAATVVWYSVDNYKSHMENNQRLADRSVESTSREIEFFINERKRFVSLFAEQEKQLLSTLVKNPANMSVHQVLENKINTYFPNRFAFTITQTNGNPLLIRGKSLIGKACRDDINLFSQGTQKNTIYVHPSPKTSRHHFDIMESMVNESGVATVLFVSFFLDDIFRLIEHGAVENHHLFLVKHGKPSVIEAATPGAIELFRQHGHNIEKTPSVKRSEFRYKWPDSLNKSATAQSLVSGTHWTLLDVVDPELGKRYIKRLMVQAMGIFFLFLVVTLAGFWLTKRLGIVFGDTKIVLNTVEKERQRVAMELHDQVLSDISHLRRDCRKLNQEGKLQKVTENSAEPNSIEVSGNNIDAELEQITNTFRHIIDDLHPQSIELVGVAETIRAYCKKHYQQKTMQVNLLINDWDESRLNQTEQLNIFRIFQEVIHNVNKHADAAQCEVKLDMTQNKLQLLLQDNGKGFSVNEAEQSQGRGIKNISARARMLHAKTNWISTSGGTVFSFEMPLREIA